MGTGLIMHNRARLAVLIPALLVAAGAVAATAHGLFEVAAAAHVPPQVAWLYPLITDGLALVAYAATHQLHHRAGVVYAWGVVVVAAGLSGLAQATYLASGPALDTSAVLRFGVGAWPAVAGAVAAHLVFLLSRRPDVTEVADHGHAEPADVREVTSDVPTVADLVAERAPLHSVPINAEPTPPAGIPMVKVSPARTATQTASARVTDQSEEMLAQVRDLVAAGNGRPAIATTLGVKDHVARALMAKASQ